MLTNVLKTIKAQDAQNGELLFVSGNKGTELALKINHPAPPGANPTPLFLTFGCTSQQDAFNVPVLRYAQNMTPCTSLGTEWFIEPDIDSLSLYKGEVLDGMPVYKAIEAGNYLLFQGTEGYLYYTLDETITRVFGSTGLFPRCFQISDRSLNAGNSQEGYLAIKHWRLGIPRKNAPDVATNPVDWLVATRSAPWPLAARKAQSSA